MKPITDFNIKSYSDIYDAINFIYKTIVVPNPHPKSITYVFDEEKSVRWNREQVELYNKELADTRKQAIEVRGQSFKNLDKAVVDFMLEYEASSSTPRVIVEHVVRRAQADHDDDWWNYLSNYLDFAELIIKASEELV